VGHGLAIHNPLVHPERILSRAFRDALSFATYQRRGEELQVLERLQDIILRERVVTAYQPILRLKDKTVLGFEALSRGARGSGLETADALFGAATTHELLLELDRLCRARALLSSGRIPSNAKLFVNTLPATIRDPQFRGKPLIDFLDRAQVSPERIVIEITEKLVIENYGLFREAMAYFTDLGMSFAVDDVGAGYSGLEAIARLKPAFLKIDNVLVRDVHSSLVNREMVKAIISLGLGIGATVIAEGIQTDEETQALQSIGIDYGQGYFWPVGRRPRVKGRPGALFLGSTLAALLTVAWLFAKQAPLRAGLELDAQHHVAAVRELAKGGFPPRHNLVAGYQPQGHYGPYLWHSDSCPDSPARDPSRSSTPRASRTWACSCSWRIGPPRAWSVRARAAGPPSPRCCSGGPGPGPP
jgi:EAL domain-containing protein (putative c-di-GMP-specific phosphodiesterase class I)